MVVYESFFDEIVAELVASGNYPKCKIYETNDEGDVMLYCDAATALHLINRFLLIQTEGERLYSYFDSPKWEKFIVFYDIANYDYLFRSTLLFDKCLTNG